MLLHEMGGSLDTYSNLVAHLETDYRILRFDLRGAGLSQKIVGQVELEDFSDDLKALIVSRGITDPVSLVGVSFGCAVAIQYANQNPAGIRSLILLTPSTAPPRMGVQATLELTEQIEAKGVGPFVDELIDGDFPVASQRDAEMLVQVKGRFASNDSQSLVQTWRLMTRLALSEKISRVGCPTRVVAGMQDTWRDVDSLNALAQAFPKGRFLALDVGHYMLIKNPDLIAASIRQFLNND